MMSSSDDHDDDIVIKRKKRIPKPPAKLSDYVNLSSTADISNGKCAVVTCANIYLHA